MCDGGEKNAPDQDAERTTCKDSSVDRTCSITSQDTDVNLDSELISKDEIDLSKSAFCHSNILIEINSHLISFILQLIYRWK